MYQILVNHYPFNMKSIVKFVKDVLIRVVEGPITRNKQLFACQPGTRVTMRGKAGVFSKKQVSDSCIYPFF